MILKKKDLLKFLEGLEDEQEMTVNEYGIFCRAIVDGVKVSRSMGNGGNRFTSVHSELLKPGQHYGLTVTPPTIPTPTSISMPPTLS